MALEEKRRAALQQELPQERGEGEDEINATEEEPRTSDILNSISSSSSDDSFETADPFTLMGDSEKCNNINGSSSGSERRSPGLQLMMANDSNDGFVLPNMSRSVPSPPPPVLFLGRHQESTRKLL